MLDRIDTAGKSLWQLIEERAALLARRRDARRHAGRHAHLRRVQGPRRARRRGLRRARSHRRNPGLVDPPLAQGSVRAHRRARASRRRAEPDPPDLPRARSRVHGPPDASASCSWCRARSATSTTRRWPRPRPRASTPRCSSPIPTFPTATPSTLGPPASNEGNPVRWVMYTSGTIADPKGARHTDATLSAANTSMQEAMQISSDDNVAVVFPITHVGGLLWTFNMMENARSSAARRDLRAGHHHPVPPEVRRDLRGRRHRVPPRVPRRAAQPARRAALPQGAHLQRRRRPQARHPALRAHGGDGRAGDLGLGAHRVLQHHDGPARRPRRQEGVDRGPTRPGRAGARRRARRGARARSGRGGRAPREGPAVLPRLPRLQPRCSTRSTPTAGSAPATSA